MAEFCPGCTEKGNYVGTVTTEAFQVVADDGWEKVSIVRVGAYFKDEDGFSSVGIPLDIENQLVATAAGERYQKDPTTVASYLDAKDRVAETAVDRIARCTGSAVCAQMRNRGQIVQCPAINEGVLNELFRRAVQEQ